MASSLNLLAPSPYSTPMFVEPLISLEALPRGIEIGIRLLPLLASALSSCCSRQVNYYQQTNDRDTSLVKFHSHFFIFFLFL